MALALKAATARAAWTTTNAYERIGIICRTIIGILTGPVPLSIPLDQTVSNTQIMQVGRIIVGVAIILHPVSTLVPWLVGSPADWWYIGVPISDAEAWRRNAGLHPGRLVELPHYSLKQASPPLERDTVVF